jgi:putative transposase
MGTRSRDPASDRRFRSSPSSRLALVADTSLSGTRGTRAARELDRLMMERGKPKMVVSDNGSELTSNVILTIRAASHGTTSRWASPFRMPSSRASTAGRGINC